MRDLAVCPLCGNADSQELYRFQPARWIPGRVVRCSACQTTYKIPSDRAKPLAEYYDQSYAELDGWNQEEAAERTLKKIRAAIVGTVGIPSLLLDVGCGSGVFLSLAQQSGFDVTGVELNPTLADKASRKARTEVVVGDFMSVDLGDQQFDVITLLDLIEHLPDPLAALKRCCQLLKPDGYLVAYTPNHSGLIVQIANLLYRLTRGRVAEPIAEIFDCTHVVFFDVRTLRLAIIKAGFSVEKTMLLKYDPSRSNQATGISALGLRAIEAISPPINGQFRILMFARKRSIIWSYQ